LGGIVRVRATFQNDPLPGANCHPAAIFFG
jgi:hypothetical protein